MDKVDFKKECEVFVRVVTDENKMDSYVYRRPQLMTDTFLNEEAMKIFEDLKNKRKNIVDIHSIFIARNEEQAKQMNQQEREVL